MLKSFGYVLSVLFVPVAATAGAAAPPSPAEPGGERLVIPFAPPLERDLRYDITIAKISKGKEQTSGIVQIVRFSRAGDGFVLTVRMLQGGVLALPGIDLSSAAGRDTVPEALKPLFAPISFDLDAKGNLLRVRDWPMWQKNMAAMLGPLSGLIEKDASKRAQAKLLLDHAMGQFATLTAEQAAASLLKGWPSILGYGGLEVEADTEYESADELAAAILPVPIPVVSHYSLSSNGPHLQLRQRSEGDKEAMAAALSQYFSSLAIGMDEATRANLRKGAAAMEGMQIVDEIEILFDRTTGLADWAKIERRATVQGGEEAIERTIIQRAKP